MRLLQTIWSIFSSASDVHLADGERAFRRERHPEQPIEPLGSRGRLELLRDGENRDVRYLLLSRANGIARDGLPRGHVEEIADDMRAAGARNRDDRGAIGNRWIRVIDDDRCAFAENLSEDAALPRFACRRIRPQVLADVSMRCREVLIIESRLARARQPDEDDTVGQRET